MKIVHVVGARPNFPKLAPVYAAARQAGLDQVVVHTGQHYDEGLSDVFFSELELPRPDYFLGIGSGTHAEQTARVMLALEPLLLSEEPKWVVVYGDINSTLAASLVAAKLCIPIAHVEAGLRSGDRSMPEEVNRLVVDRLASLLLAPSRDAVQTLMSEGVSKHQIAFVGNVMADTVLARREQALRGNFISRHQLPAKGLVVVTLHRPSNVDSANRLRLLVSALQDVAADHCVVFPIHPRTKQRLLAERLELGNVHELPPLSYLEMLQLMLASKCVVTDSGGMQEETTVLGIPCFTLRDNTERPVTVKEGTNVLVKDPATLSRLIRQLAPPVELRRPEGWDGGAGERAVRAILEAQL
jgi:UDP-N-acetylglucosamine 2-epimerase (non-hydrolysing)